MLMKKNKNTVYFAIAALFLGILVMLGLTIRYDNYGNGEVEIIEPGTTNQNFPTIEKEKFSEVVINQVNGRSKLIALEVNAEEDVELTQSFLGLDVFKKTKNKI